ncbi:CPBP family intramembrane glutamic endopeptidase [Natronoarchaeum sp. GCM10025321]|uniref:CPBP family intramembrane glutamic endopeptidase n=1 Tax=Natronoarchaeum sp. GCM10025321 TaxID=3252684 RepID=UPI00361ADB14
MNKGSFSGLGIVLATVAAATTLQPWPSVIIVAEPIDVTVSAAALATAFSFLTLAGFLARRYDWLDRPVGVAFTVTGSVGVVGSALTALAVVTDAGASVSLWPPLAAVFGTATGLTGVVEWSELRIDEVLDRSEAVVARSIVAVGALLVAGVLDAVLRPIATVLFSGNEMLASALASPTAAGLGLTVVAAVYLYWHDDGLEFVDLDWLDTRELLYCIGGFIGLLVALIFAAELLAGLGVPSSRSGVVEQGIERSPDIFLAVLPVSMLLVGPAEELLFRNVIQKSLYATFSQPSAVVLSSVLYAAIYLPAYATVSFPAALGGLALAFVLSLVLAYTYAQTDNLLVPTVIHGGFNAFQYAVLYVAVTREVGVV